MAPRRKPQRPVETPAQQDDAKRAKVRSIIGGNVDPATLKKHWGAVKALELKLSELRGQLAAAWKAAEADGIAKKPAKLVFKLFKEDPATIDAFMRQVQGYATQLGLFDRIDEWKSEEEREANAGSVDRAESDLRKHASPQTEPTSGGRDEAIYAQGFEASKGGCDRDPPAAYVGDDGDTWLLGYDAASLKRVDAANSELASAGA